MLIVAKGWMKRAPAIAAVEAGMVGAPEAGEEAADVALSVDMIADAI